ncbi:hypothetical protein GCM10023318_18150 [Nocardia callitridis]|uniref:DUF1109 domain-containing protein n=2 Tax=Nocardia callitridis TaxID=648753 RepID=A0ABP9K1H2_9NOCA
MSLLTGLVVVCCGALVWQIAVDGAFGTRIILWVILAVLGAFALPLGLTGLARRRAVLLSLASPVIIVILCALVQFQIPESVGWQLSRGILADQSVECADPGGPTRLGVYSITAVVRQDGGCLFWVRGGESDPHGFGYFPDGPPPTVGAAPTPGIRYEPYEPHWYRFTEQS